MRSLSTLTLATLALAGLAVAAPTFTTSAAAAAAKSKAAPKTRAAAQRGVHWDCRSGICVNPVGTYKYHIDPNGYVIYD